MAIYDTEGLPLDPEGTRRHGLNLKSQLAAQRFYQQLAEAFRAYGWGKEDYRQAVMRMADSINGDFRAVFEYIERPSNETLGEAERHLIHMEKTYPALFGDGDVFRQLKDAHGIKK